MPVLTPYIVSCASILRSSIARQVRMRASARLRQLHLLAVAGDADDILDRQRRIADDDWHG